MSSDSAASMPGRKPGALDRAHERRSALLRWWRTRARSRLRPRRRSSLPALAPSALPPRGRSRRPWRSRRRRSQSDRHHHQVLHDRVRARRAPPPKIWISGSGNDTGGIAGDIAPQRTPLRRRRAACATASDAATGSVAAQPRLVGRAIEMDERTSIARRTGCTHRCSRVPWRSDHSHWPPPARRRDRRSACPPSRRSMASRATARRAAERDRPARRARRRRDLGFDGRPAARVPDAAGVYPGNGRAAHLPLICQLTATRRAPARSGLPPVAADGPRKYVRVLLPGRVRRSRIRPEKLNPRAPAATWAAGPRCAPPAWPTASGHARAVRRAEARKHAR